MRRLFVIAMLLLLPLRGWAGDVMAIGMAAADRTTAAPTMALDCPSHAMADDGSQDAGDADVVCQSCDLCLPFAYVGPAGLAVLSNVRHARPLHAAPGLFGVLLAPRLKPPIS